MSAPDDKDWTEGHRHGPLISSAIRDPFDPEAGGFSVDGEAPIIPPALVPTALQGPLRFTGGWVDYGGSYRLKGTTMSAPETYAPVHDSGMVSVPKGDWVRLSDYLAAVQERDEARAERDRLSQKHEAAIDTILGERARADALTKRVETLERRAPHVVIIAPGEAGLFHATSPDVPGLFVSGTSVAEVRAAVPVVLAALAETQGEG